MAFLSSSQETFVDLQGAPSRTRLSAAVRTPEPKAGTHVQRFGTKGQGPLSTRKGNAQRAEKMRRQDAANRYEARPF
jgi:hypothetical protein